ncbi:MAG: hypothetical protein AB3N64_04085 [Puniceicoccaceae bacterium]
MKAIHIRDLSEETLAGLKRRAARHRRSLQKEAQIILEEAARMQETGEDKRELRLHRVNTGRRGSWKREEMYGEDGR